MPYVVMKLEFDRLPGLNRVPIRFEPHELNRNQCRRTVLIGVVYGAPIAMKGITLACKNKWKSISGSFSIAAMGFKSILKIFEKEDDKIWVMSN